MEVQDAMAQARDSLTVNRVFGEPYEKNGVTVIPVAKIQGGAGGGAVNVSRDKRSAPELHGASRHNGANVA